MRKISNHAFSNLFVQQIILGQAGKSFHIQGDKIIHIWQDFNEKRLKNIWWKSKIQNINSWTYGLVSWPKFVHILMHNSTLFHNTRKAAHKLITKLQNFNKKLETDFIVAGSFKASKRFHYVTDIARKLLASRTSPHTPRIGRTESRFFTNIS